jgi:hypothetical protein
LDYTTSRNDAKVREKALIIQDDSAAVIFNEMTRDGIAENNAVMLNASMNWAKQTRASKAYFRNVESCFGAETLSRSSGVLRDILLATKNESMNDWDFRKRNSAVKHECP